MINNTNLIEPSIKNYLNETLKKCRLFKENYINFIFNLSMLIIFILIFGTFLYFRYKGKCNFDKYKRYKEKKNYIISKINKLNKLNIINNKMRKDNDLITDLPIF